MSASRIASKNSQSGGGADMNRPEQSLQRELVRLLTLLERQGKFTFFHPANGAYRSAKVAAIFTGMGVKSGVADLILLVKGVAVAIEIKAAKGRLAPSQIEWREQWEQQGGRWFEVRSVDDLMAALATIGVSI